jgi:hypothetical protein
MPHTSPAKIHKIEHPQSYYGTPDELLHDQEMSLDEKLKALNIWEQDARQLMTASNEGMPGSQEGIKHYDHHMLGQVERAKNELSTKSTHKTSH